MKRRRKWLRLFFIVLLGGLAFAAAIPGGPDLNLQKIGINYKKQLNIQQGLDLQGGSHLVYEADLSKVKPEDHSKAMQSLEDNISRRVNSFGIGEPNIYTSNVGDKRQLVVELPGVKDVDKAMELIGKTAQLNFQEINAAGNGLQDTGLTGKNLTNATVDYDSQTGKPEVAITFDADGTKLFAELTKKNLNKPLIISLDNTPISQPTVQAEITSGKAVITGQFTVDEAKKLAIELNAGALPVPIKNVEQRTVGATLGQDSVRKSVFAGVLGIIIVSLFMLYYYRVLGVFSTIGLGLYLAFMITLFKLFSFTLTMGGVAGLILSVGMSMETDVLIFERIREELRNGRSFLVASNLGFQKAWPSIRDSNMVSLIICVILYYAGGLIRGFAVVLGLGITMGLTTTFLGTRTLIELISTKKFVKNNKLFRVEEINL